MLEDAQPELFLVIAILLKSHQFSGAISRKSTPILWDPPQFAPLELGQRLTAEKPSLFSHVRFSRLPFTCSRDPVQ